MLPGSKFFDPRGIVDEAARYVEPALTVGSSLASEPLAGWYGLVSGNPENVEKLHHATTYQPRTESGREGLAGLGGALSGVGADIMATPYLGQSVRYYGESADKLGAQWPVMGAALKTAPAFVASVFAPEARGAFSAVGGDIGRTMASGGNIGRGGMAAQRGAVTPATFIEPFKKVSKQGFKFSRAGVGSLAGERTAQRVGGALERTHKAYVAEKTATQGEHTEGRNLLAAH